MTALEIEEARQEFERKLQESTDCHVTVSVLVWEKYDDGYVLRQMAHDVLSANAGWKTGRTPRTEYGTGGPWVDSRGGNSSTTLFMNRRTRKVETAESES